MQTSYINPGTKIGILSLLLQERHKVSNFSLFVTLEAQTDSHWYKTAVLTVLKLKVGKIYNYHISGELITEFETLIKEITFQMHAA